MIILENIPYSLTESFKRTYKMNPPPIPKGNISAAFKTIETVSILMMTGVNDNAIIAEEANQIKETNKNSASKFISFKGGGHDLSGEQFRQVYSESITSFLSSLK